MFSLSAINSGWDFVQLPIISLYTTFYMHGMISIVLKGWRSLNIHRLMVNMFDIVFNLTHDSTAPWRSQYLYRETTGFVKVYIN